MMSAEEGLQTLIDGNERFQMGNAHFPTVCKETLADLARGQQPYATILGCSDSRVPPELIFDANFGELFIVRVAGNVDIAGGNRAACSTRALTCTRRCSWCSGTRAAARSKPPSTANFTTCNIAREYRFLWTTSCPDCVTLTRMRRMKINSRRPLKRMCDGRCARSASLRRGASSGGRPRQTRGRRVRDRHGPGAIYRIHSRKLLSDSPFRDLHPAAGTTNSHCAN